MLNSLPPLASFPTIQARAQLPPSSWTELVELWTAIVQIYIQCDPSDLVRSTESTVSATAFLSSYYSQQSGSPSHPTEVVLHRQCFLLTHKLILEDRISTPELLRWEFLADFCHAYVRTKSLSVLLDRLWVSHASAVQTSLNTIKSSLSADLASSPIPSSVLSDLRRLTNLVHASHDAGAFLMIGSDMIDSLHLAYSNVADQSRPGLVVFTYLCLSALLKGASPKASLLIDHLFSLQAQTTSRSTPSLLSDIVTNTPLLGIITSGITDKNVQRGNALVEVLWKYHQLSIARLRPPSKRTHPVDKGKGKAVRGEDQHVHSMSLITQIQDLFPDLGSGFVARLLDTYNDDVEVVTSHLLEDSLPDHLRSLDRSAALPEPGVTAEEVEQRKIEHLVPHAPRSSLSASAPTKPPTSRRRNVFDNDDFDRLAVDPSRLHVGRRERLRDVDEADEHRPNKTAILAALAAFDSDDDERDDTYDVADVGDTVDAARPDGEDDRDIRVSGARGGQPEPSPTDMTLFGVWQSHPELFGRSSDVRRSQPRQALRAETGMTDEMLEGWAVMVSRDPKMVKRFQERATAFDGGQTSLARSAYREGEEGTDSDGRGEARYRGRGGRGRGRGQTSLGRGGAQTTAGSSASRQHKEANKGSRANHNRKDQRGKKLARAGFPG